MEDRSSALRPTRFRSALPASLCSAASRNSPCASFKTANVAMHAQGAALDQQKDSKYSACKLCRACLLIILQHDVHAVVAHCKHALGICQIQAKLRTHAKAQRYVSSLQPHSKKIQVPGKSWRTVTHAVVEHHRALVRLKVVLAWGAHRAGRGHRSHMQARSAAHRHNRPRTQGLHACSASEEIRCSSLVGPE